MDCLVDEHRAALLDFIHCGEGVHQVHHSAGGFRLLHALVLGGALADEVIDQVKQLAMGLTQGLRLQFGMSGNKIAQLFKNAQLQMPALADEFFQPITLLPAMQTVFYPLFLFVSISGPGVRSARTGAQLEFVGVKDGWNVIKELPERERAPGHLLWIGTIQLSPSRENRLPTCGKEVTQVCKLLVFDRGHFRSDDPQVVFQTRALIDTNHCPAGTVVGRRLSLITDPTNGLWRTEY